MSRPAATMRILVAACSSSALLGQAPGSPVGSERLFCFESEAIASLPMGSPRGTIERVGQGVEGLKRLADLLLGFSEGQLTAAQAAGELMEVESHGRNEKKS